MANRYKGVWSVYDTVEKKWVGKQIVELDEELQPCLDQTEMKEWNVQKVTEWEDEYGGDDEQ